MNFPGRRNNVAPSAWVLLSLILLAGLGFRALTVVVLRFEPEGDYLAYQTMALNLLGGRGIVDQLGNYAMMNVGYPLFVLAPVFALSDNSLLAAQLANAVLGVASTVLCYAIAAEANAGRFGRLLAAGLFALYLPSWVYAESLAKENLMTPLMLAVMWCALRFLRGSSLAVALYCGVLFGFLALTGNAGLALVPAAVVALTLSPGSARFKTTGALIAIAAGLIVVAPWLARNYAVIGSAVLNTNGGFNLYLGNNPAATGLFVSIADTPRGPTWSALRKEGEYRASQTLRQEAIAWIQEHPGRFAELALRKALLFWKPPIHEGKGQPTRGEAMIRRLWLAQYLLIVGAAVCAMLLPALRTRQTAVLLLAVAGYTAVHMVFYVIYRYREPVIPLLCVLAALAIERAWVAWRGRLSPLRPGRERR